MAALRIHEPRRRLRLTCAPLSLPCQVSPAKSGPDRAYLPTLGAGQLLAALSPICPFRSLTSVASTIALRREPITAHTRIALARILRWRRPSGEPAKRRQRPQSKRCWAGDQLVSATGGRFRIEAHSATIHIPAAVADAGENRPQERTKAALPAAKARGRRLDTPNPDGAVKRMRAARMAQAALTNRAL
jgi:hypothetical protein